MYFTPYDNIANVLVTFALHAVAFIIQSKITYAQQLAGKKAFIYISLIIHFKTNLQVIIYIIYINGPDNNFINYLRPANGISNNYLIVASE